MCHLNIIQYSCGCTNKGAFFQCATRQNTNVKCATVPERIDQHQPHFCSNHMVTPIASQYYVTGPDGRQRMVENTDGTCLQHLNESK